MAVTSRSGLSRRAFTLIEVLVVLAIIAVLIALLVPAVQKVRAQVALAQCANNLKQLGVAALNYESQNKCFPPGYIGPRRNETMDASIAQGDPEDNQWVGHLPMLLPHLEQGPLYQQIQVNFDVRAQTPPWWEPEPSPNYAVASQPVAVFLCPADQRPEPKFQAGSSKGTVIGIHFYSKGPFVQFDRRIENYDDGFGATYNFRLARTNYIGSGGSGRGTGNAAFAGIYTNRSANTMATISDGASNTFLYGETGGRADMDMAAGNQVDESLTISWFGGGAVPSYFGVARGDQATWYQFSSTHPGGVQFCFADGSVRLFAFTTSPYTIQQMSGMRDNQTVGQ